MLHIAVLGSTRGTDLRALIEAIQNKILDASIDIVISDRKDAYILERAKAYAIPALYINPKGTSREEFDRDIISALKGCPIDFILLIGYMRILSSVFVDTFKDRIINVHPSLLPAFAGGMDINVHEAVLKSGVQETGCTVHLVDRGIDTGKILLQKKCRTYPTDTPESLKERVQKLEGDALIEVLQKIKL